ncbi:MAG: THUMP-like domain-containing protein, partial [Patescibacteria group bacterium]
MQIADINFLNSPEGRELVKKYQDLSDLDVYRQLMKAPQTKNPYLSAVVTLIKLRKKALGKFSKSAKMFFTPLSLEQATGEEISKYIAARFGQPKKIVDLTCSIGGNLIFLAAQAKQIIAVDKNDVNILCAEFNTEVYQVKNKIKFICGDAFDNIISDADAFFIDPSRERSGKTKTKSILNCEPNLLKIIPAIFKASHNLGVKISPAFDYQEIKLLPEEPEIEIISEDNVCKVAMLWFGDFKTCARRATCLIGEKIYSYQSQDILKPIKVVPAPLTYLYEPNKAIIKGHLIEEVAGEFSLNKINRQTSYLTSDKLIENNRELFRIWQVLNFAPFSLKEIKTELKLKKIERVNIITKRFPQKPAE